MFRSETDWHRGGLDAEQSITLGRSDAWENLPTAGKPGSPGPPAASRLLQTTARLAGRPVTGRERATCDALWQGVPVATVRGARHSGRVTESLLAGAGLAEEWVFPDEEAWLAGLAGRIQNPVTLPDRPTLARRFRDRQKTRAPELARALETIYRDLAGA